MSNNSITLASICISMANKHENWENYIRKSLVPFHLMELQFDAAVTLQVNTTFNFQLINPLDTIVRLQVEDIQFEREKQQQYIKNNMTYMTETKAIKRLNLHNLALFPMDKNRNLSKRGPMCNPCITFTIFLT